MIRVFFNKSDSELCPLLIKRQGDNRSYLRIDILSSQHEGLLDSGANRTVMNPHFAKTLFALGLKATKMQPVGVATADGVTHNITDIIDVPIRLDNQFQVIPIMIMPHLTQQLILGKDFFERFGIQFHFKSNVSSNSPHLETIDIKNPVIISRENLNIEQQQALAEMIQNMKETVGVGLGQTSVLKHIIDTSHNKPIHQKQYNFSPVIKKEIEREVDEMIKLGVIEPSISPWCSPVLIVKKPNGTNRLCLDSRQLNRITKRDTYPLPRVTNVIDNLRNAKFLSTIDLRSAFWQIQLEDSSKEKTAFAVPGKGLYQFRVMPFGLVNASQTQQRLMDILFHSEEEKVWAYLDDIVICSADFEEHLRLLRKVTEILKTAKLTINVDKCQFARPSLRYLGYIIDKNGLRTDPEKVEAIINYPRPKTFTELKRFIGLASWYRRFVKDFAVVAAPLHNLTKGKKTKTLKWTIDAESAFIKMKTLLTTTPVVTCPDYRKPFVIQCDASNIGIGAVLCQETNGMDQPIAYLSRKLNDREAKYSTSERELLSVVYAIEKFRPYIDGTRFTVVTDHSALLWLHRMKDPHGRLARWAVKLQQFDFDVVHRPGKCHVVPDALSRGLSKTSLELHFIEIQEHHKDRWYQRKLENVCSGNQDGDWTVENGLLFKRVAMKQFPNSDDLWKLFVPETLRAKVFEECHDNPTAGHLGIRKTYFKIRQKYYWHNMLRDVKKYVQECNMCASHKASQKLPFGQMGKHREVSQPWQVVAMDLMGPFPKSKKCNTMLLVITCLFSKFSLLFPLRSGKADKICDILRAQILLYGVPKLIICDNAKQFQSNLFKEVVTQFNSTICFTPHYHPQSNNTERVNRVIGTMIATYIKSQKHNEWDAHLEEIGHAIRTAVHEATGFTPSYLFLGRETSVPNPIKTTLQDKIDSDTTIQVNTANYIQGLKERNYNYKHVKDRIIKAHYDSSKYYNRRTRPGTFEIGDIVWKKTKYLSNANKKFMAKLAPKFEKAIIVGKLSNNVFRLNNAYGKAIGTWHIKDLKEYNNKK